MADGSGGGGSGGGAFAEVDEKDVVLLGDDTLEAFICPPVSALR